MRAVALKTIARAAIFLALLVAPGTAAAGPTEIREHAVRSVAYYSSAFDVPVELVEAVIEVESAWNPYAVSKKGAAGLMQLMPQTARRFGVQDRFNIDENIRGGVAYLAWLIRLFKGDLRLAVAAYQTGESQILLRGLAYASPEVFDYVRRVAELYRALRRETARRLPKHAVAAEP